MEAVILPVLGANMTHGVIRKWLKQEGDRVEVGARVTVQEEDYEPETYQVVGAKEADPRNGRISNESPIGKAILGHKIGDSVKVETPGGTYTVKILKIS